MKLEKKKCGIIMPISQIDDVYSKEHWVDVKTMLMEAIEATGFQADIVSNADDIGIIQKRIIQNIYDNPLIVCDVSGKNPNVMFELGLRLAFDKPTIIVKDDKTSYSFDTSPIEHLTYPRDLRYNQIVDFKKELSDKIIGTYRKSQEEANFSTFLKHFGQFTVAKLETTEVSKEEFLIEELKEIRQAIGFLTKERNISLNQSHYSEGRVTDLIRVNSQKNIALPIDLRIKLERLIKDGMPDNDIAKLLATEFQTPKPLILKEIKNMRELYDNMEDSKKRTYVSPGGEYIQKR